ncbi:hypothetical protein [Novosphingopyxis sp. YJ-S2-01]|uniref:hypothetical protein n=1 Tax=Novosphingopyxis sp. YJ-S2-01 TaxID=2794021 RepID=UPI0018DC608D|nr:hypothetical protein [Novosphingopyxis sp. YJ-S2-01]MBH9537204.1 hypothetical protein [Novosphingopyxis sp. YJ-S2-01]
MNFAFLYNSDDPSLIGNYCYDFRELVLNTGILQKCDRPMRFAEGDITTFGHSRTYEEYKALTLRVVQPVSTQMLLERKMADLLPNITVATMAFQNMDTETAEALHCALLEHECYLGVVDVEFSLPEHLAMFRNALCENGRFNGRSVSLFYSMGDLENSEDTDFLDQLSAAGFNATYVDTGARRTIFDDFDTLEHFQRIHDFAILFTTELAIPEPEVSNFCHALEEVQPRLFETLFSAGKALRNASTADEVAQVGLACRRFLKLLTDAWFPGIPKAKFGTRDVTDGHVKNRFWAHLEKNVGLSGTTLTEHGKRFDALWEQASKYLHENDPRADEVVDLLQQVMSLVSDVIALDFEAATRPYTAYEGSIRSFWKDVVADREAP